MRAAAAGLALLLVTALAHWPGPGAEFSQDDVDFVVANQSIRSLGGALAAFGRPFPPDQPQRGLYRPLVNASYALDFALFGTDARGFHLTNLVLYLGVVLLVLRLGRSYGMSPGAAFAAALLFALHPVHCEAVDSVAGRSEILALLFGLASLLLFLAALAASGGARQRRLLASATCQLLAGLSKESAAVLPVLLALHALVLRAPAPHLVRPTLRNALRLLVPSLVALAAQLLLRQAVLDRFGPAFAPLAGSDLQTRLLTLGRVALAYARLLVFPDVLQVDYYYQIRIGIVSEWNASSLLGWLVAAVPAAVAGRALYRQLRTGESGSSPVAWRRGLALCGAGFLYAYLLPVAHLVEIGALMAERFLFAPSLGFVLLAVLAGQRGLGWLPWPRARRPAAIALVVAIAVPGAWRSHARAAEWRDAARLWQSAAEELPDDVRVFSNLASIYLDRGQPAPARAALERAQALDPDAHFVLGNLGVLLILENRLAEARATYERMIEMEPDDALAWTHLGDIEARLGNHAAALDHYQKALELNPNLALLPARIELSRRALGQSSK